MVKLLTTKEQRGRRCVTLAWWRVFGSGFNNQYIIGK